MWITHGRQLRIISETISNQTIDNHIILIHTIHQNLNKLSNTTNRYRLPKKKNINIYIKFLTVIDDFADDTDFTRKSQLLHQLYIRGRHYMISTITSTQVYKQISPIVRNNMTHLFIYRLRNYNGLEPIVE